ncbi:MAG: ATP-grasp domain-containing protein [Nitriliruptorales bacterium]|nr:ATP-grasp domain-containing protein [Nitriliruptorales bacterium]
MAVAVDFDELQRRLSERLRDSPPEQGTQTMVVCPSISFPVAELRKIVGIQFYEERLLCLTLLLRDPELEIVYPTSVAIDDAIIEYYLSWLPDPAGARERLHLVAVGDVNPRALTDKLLSRPDLLAALRGKVRDPLRSLILPFNVTHSEARLAEVLGIPLYGPHPDLVDLGSKSGARRVAVAAGVKVFEGAGDLYSVEAIERAVDRIRRARPDAPAVVAKLNHGFSGQGNVVLPLAGMRRPLQASTAVFCASEESWETFAPKVEADGAIVEELARAPGVVSPSVQLRILSSTSIEIVSTHDQILGGPDEQVYLGCRFPADGVYRREIQEAALRVGEVLAARGVIGSLGIDFVVVPDQGVHLSEINLRSGGTTHPFLMVRYVAEGEYDPVTGELLVNGVPRVYKASDNIKSERYVGLRPADVIAAVARAGLAYDHTAGTGATLHLLGALPGYGKYGLVCIAGSHEEAGELYQRVVQTVDRLGS